MKTTVRRVLSHMIGKELATKINWVGKGDKIPFKKPKTTQRFDRYVFNFFISQFSFVYLYERW